MQPPVARSKFGSERPLPGTRSLGALFLFCAVSCGVVALYALRGAVQTSPLELPFARQLDPVLWLPEGWKFFTRDAREARMELYVHDASGWRDAALGPNSRPANKFGLDRIARAQGIELGLLTQYVDKSTWQACSDKDAFRCLDAAHALRRLVNKSPQPSLCGEVGLVSRKPVPWAWASQGLHVDMPITFVRLEVQC